MGRILAVLRMGTFLFLLMIFVGFYLTQNAIWSISAERRFRIRGRFSRLSMRILGVSLKMEGLPIKHQGPYLIICNHRSLLDPLVCAGYLYAYFLSKAEVGDYPLIGPGSKLTGVIFVERESKESRANTRATIRKTLEEGKNVLLYPEGTTNGADVTKQFFMGSFVVAAELNVPVLPVILEYKTRTDYWVDGGLLAKSVEQFSKWRTHLYLWVGQPIQSTSPEELLKTSQAEMDKKILEIQKNWGNL